MERGGSGEGFSLICPVTGINVSSVSSVSEIGLVYHFSFDHCFRSVGFDVWMFFRLGLVSLSVVAPGYLMYAEGCMLLKR